MGDVQAPSSSTQVNPLRIGSVKITSAGSNQIVPFDQGRVAGDLFEAMLGVIDLYPCNPRG